jgi:hypothetical protein
MSPTIEASIRKPAYDILSTMRWLLAVILVASPVRAEASLLELWAETGMGGLGFGGAQGGKGQTDFFDAASGGALSLSVGAHVLFMDGWIDHYQLFGGELGGSYTQFMAGFGGTYDVAAAKLWLGIGGGYGRFSFPEAARAPDATAVVAQTRFGGEYKLFAFGAGAVGLGAWASVSYHYQLGAVVDIDVTGRKLTFDPVHGLHFAMLGGVRVHLQI